MSDIIMFNGDDAFESAYMKVVTEEDGSLIKVPERQCYNLCMALEGVL